MGSLEAVRTWLEISWIVVYLYLVQNIKVIKMEQAPLIPHSTLKFYSVPRYSLFKYNNKNRLLGETCHTS